MGDLYRRIWGEAPPEREPPTDRPGEPSSDGAVGELRSQIEALRQEIEAMAGELNSRLKRLEGRLDEAEVSKPKAKGAARKQPKAAKRSSGTSVNPEEPE